MPTLPVLYPIIDGKPALRYGTVSINDHMPVASEMPFGGFGHSGHGKDMALDALNNYTEAKHVMTRNSAWV